MSYGEVCWCSSWSRINSLALCLSISTGERQCSLPFSKFSCTNRCRYNRISRGEEVELDKTVADVGLNFTTLSETTLEEKLYQQTRMVSSKKL